MNPPGTSSSSSEPPWPAAGGARTENNGNSSEPTATVGSPPGAIATQPGTRRPGWRPGRGGGAWARFSQAVLDFPGQVALRVTRAGWLFLALIVVLGAMYLGLASRGAEAKATNWPMLLMYVMIGLALAGWIFGWLSMRQYAVARVLPPRAFSGESCPVRLQIAQVGGWFPPAGLRLDDTVQHRAGLWYVFIAAVASGTEAEAIYRFRPLKRGVYQFGPILANSDFPLGLIRHFRRLPCTDELLVYPSPGTILEWPFAASDRRFMGEWEKVATRAPEEFRALREYHPGDALRTIHWRTSAHQNRLMTQEYEHQSRPHLTVVLDTATGAMGTGARQLETGLSYIATLAIECQRRQRLFHLCALAPEPAVVTVSQTAGSLTNCLDLLARLTPNNQRPFQDLAQFIPTHMLSSGDVLILTLASARKGLDLTPFQGRHASVQVLALGDEEFKQYFTRGGMDVTELESELRLGA
ncbi:MAG TPA: DUF58 domain-containing protein [Planctomycetota bacterium]|nr:DUF58 domain-containing protein [Planctomycetota bacterium]